MLEIIILHNHPTTFKLDFEKLSNVNQYNLHFITNYVGFEKLVASGQKHYLASLHILEEFDLNHLIPLVDTITNHRHKKFNIVTDIEQAISICGRLRQYFHLEKDHWDRLVNKLAMKQYLEASEIIYPKYLTFNKKDYLAASGEYINYICKELTFPVFAKPIDQAGSMGTQKINDRNALATWCETALLSDYIFEIDEYIEGTLYHCDSILQQGKVIYTQACQYLRPCAEFLHGKTKGSIVLHPTSNKLAKIEAYTEQVILGLNVPENGITHLEFFETKTNEFVFVELGYRSGGGLIANMYQKYLDISIPELNLLLQINEHYSVTLKQDVFTAWVAFPYIDGCVKKINQPLIKSNYEARWNAKLNETYATSASGRELAGSVLMWNKNYEQLTQDFLGLASFNPFEIH